jgi:hypothetical protein
MEIRIQGLKIDIRAEYEIQIKMHTESMITWLIDEKAKIDGLYHFEIEEYRSKSFTIINELKLEIEINMETVIKEYRIVIDIKMKDLRAALDLEWN